MHQYFASRGFHYRLHAPGWVLVVTLCGVALTAGACRDRRTTAGRLEALYAAVTPPVAPAPAAPAPATPAPAPAAAEKAAAPAAAYECRWADAPVEIDGKPDDAAWGAAHVLDKFTLPWLGKDDRPARAATRAKLLWDREYLYFFADMDDGDLYADVKEPDGEVWNNDAFELFFKPAADKNGYYEFEVSPANTVLDMFLPSRNSGGYPRFKSDGEFGMNTAVQTRGSLNHWADGDSGWSVEGRIPWKGFMRTGGRPNPDEQWAFALCRVDFSVDFEGPELSTSAPLNRTPSPDFHSYEGYAPLRFVGPAAAGRPAEAAPRAKVDYGIDSLPPLASSRVVGSPDPPLPYRLVDAFPNLKLKYPIYITRQPGSDRLVVIDEEYSFGKSGLRRLVDDPKSDKLETLLEMDAIGYEVEFHPDFANNGYVFIGRNGPATKEPRKSQVLRYRMDPKPPYALDPGSETVIIEWDSNGHNGAALAFGADGMLYVTSGDGSNDSDALLSGQDMSRLLAKVLRIDVDRPSEGRNYSIPPDNPFVGREGARPETWAVGMRNPWRMTCDPKTGQIWVGNNGQDVAEQLYLIERGANYGWSVTEGSKPFYLDRKRGPQPFATPAVEHPHSEARSLTGGEVYYGSQFPELQGAYVYGDYSTGKIWAVRHDGKAVAWHKQIADSTYAITAIGTDTKGELLVVDHAKGGVYRFQRTPADVARPPFPRKLSESGLFASVKDHAMRPGIIPYSVNAELWSDGAYKQRFIAIPAKDGKLQPIDYIGTRGWNFPEQTVIVKSFGLDAPAGGAGAGAAKRWVETRFLTKQEGEWVGYSYQWDDEQTDATLVDAAGLDREYDVADPQASGGVRKQTWHYPSRTECMVCHTSQANYVLGLQTIQMNKDHDYGGGRVANQLRTLEHLDLLRVNWSSEILGRRAREIMAEKDQGIWDAQAAANQGSSTRDQRAPVVGPLLPFHPAGTEMLVNPHDPAADLTARAKSYLHANCAHCHIEAGGGNATMDLEFATSPNRMKIIGVDPLHDAFGLADPKLVAPGLPERSVLLHRTALRGRGQMPPLATSVPDRDAVELLRQWISQAPPAVEPQAAAGGGPKLTPTP